MRFPMLLQCTMSTFPNNIFLSNFVVLCVVQSNKIDGNSEEQRNPENLDSKKYCPFTTSKDVQIPIKMSENLNFKTHFDLAIFNLSSGQ